jgi:predicted lipid-binding transport protein (Tim44 family)
MAFNQPNLFGDDQPDLFAGKQGAATVHQVNPQHVRNRFIDFLAQMSVAETWPWDDSHIETLRERTWPYLYAKLPDAAEAAEWKAKIEVEAARLDAASAKAA